MFTTKNNPTPKPKVVTLEDDTIDTGDVNIRVDGNIVAWLAADGKLHYFAGEIEVVKLG